MSEIYLVYSETRTGGVPEDPEEQWCFHSPSYIEFRPDRVFLQQQRFQETIEVPWTPIAGAKVWILVVRYQSGSTFGTSHGNWVVIGAYQNQEIPAKMAEIIRKYPENQAELSEAMKPYAQNFYANWIGYFEQLEDVEIHEMTIDGEPQNPAFRSIWHS